MPPRVFLFLFSFFPFRLPQNSLSHSPKLLYIFFISLFLTMEELKRAFERKFAEVRLQENFFGFKEKIITQMDSMKDLALPQTEDILLKTELCKKNLKINRFQDYFKVVFANKERTIVRGILYLNPFKGSTGSVGR